MEVGYKYHNNKVEWYNNMHKIASNVILEQRQSCACYYTNLGHVHSKLGLQCKKKTWWVLLHHVFKANVKLMYVELNAFMASLSDAVLPSIGRHKPIKWEYQLFLQYVVPKAT